MEADVVVVGSGAAGLTTAVVAAQAGLKVIVLESTPWFGGTTAFSMGGLWVPNNPYQEAAGVPDSREEAVTYLRAVLGNYYGEEWINAYLDNAPDMLRYMEKNTEVRFVMGPTPDYYAGEPGWKTGRTIVTLKYDGARLGRHADLVRPHIKEVGLFGSMQVALADSRRMVFWNKNLGNFMLTAKGLLRYGLDRLRGTRGRMLANGNALAGRLLKSALDAGVTLVNKSRAQHLVVEDGRVTGVVVRGEQGEFQVTARRAVVLATGGFGANAEMRRKYLPQADHGWSLQPEGAQGDGINLGVEAGGVMQGDNFQNAILTGVSAHRRADGTLAVYPTMLQTPGSLTVDAANGRRFVDESLHYLHFGMTTRNKGVTKAWGISDSLAVAHFGLGMAKPAPFSIKPWVKRGYVVEAPTIAELARKLAIDPAVLEETVATFNANADQGVDPEFGRGEKIYSKYYADPRSKPNPVLRSLRHPPYYAVEIRPGEYSTVAGLEANGKAQVIKADGSPIPGLYAVGIDANSAFRGFYPDAGCGIGPAMAFGYIAARHIAESAPVAVKPGPARAGALAGAV